MRSPRSNEAAAGSPRTATVRALADALGSDAGARLHATLARAHERAAALPEQLRPMIGRERERRHLVDLLAGPARTVTLTGPGGVGKTRLALSVAHQLAGTGRADAHWVWLGRGQ